jgi:biopolymer transport protein ExbD
VITRPLDVSTRLRPPPRSFDYLYWVNVVVIALFFTYFGSRFVLSPGIAMGKGERLLPVFSSAVAGAVPTQLTVQIAQGGQLYVDTGFVTFEKLRGWLAAQARQTPGATLLILAHPSNSVDLLNKITDAANSVGIKVQLGGLDRSPASSRLDQAN